MSGGCIMQGSRSAHEARPVVKAGGVMDHSGTSVEGRVHSSGVSWGGVKICSSG